MSMQMPPRSNLTLQNQQGSQDTPADSFHAQRMAPGTSQQSLSFQQHTPRQGYPAHAPQPRPTPSGYPQSAQPPIGVPGGRPPQPRPIAPGYPQQSQPPVGVPGGRPPQPRAMPSGYPQQNQPPVGVPGGRPPQPRAMPSGYPQQNQPPVGVPGGRPPQPQQSAVPTAAPPVSQIPVKINAEPQATPPNVQAAPRKIADIFTEEQLELFDKGKFSELHFDIQNSLKRFPNNIDAHYGLGLCSMAIGEPERAAVHLAKALELDDSIRPGEVIHEITNSDPEDWLLMAEEIGHSGFLEAASDICTKILSSNRYEAKIRALASKTKETIEQDFYAARERIVSGNAPKDKGDSTAKYKVASVFTLVVLPLLIATILGFWTYSSFKFNQGQNYLRAGIYRYERLRKGDKAQDKNRPVESYFYDAAQCFEKAHKLNPFSFEALYYLEKNYAVLYKVGEYRNRDIYNLDEYSWKPGRFKEVESSRRDVLSKIKSKNVSVERMNNEKKLWQDFYQQAKIDPGTAVF
ncbi:MAG: hypothetical protein ACI38Q_02380 [Candidatus Bruticola sp.]